MPLNVSRPPPPPPPMLNDTTVGNLSMVGLGGHDMRFVSVVLRPAVAEGSRTKDPSVGASFLNLLANQGLLHPNITKAWSGRVGSLDRLCRAIAGWCRAKGAYSSADPSGRGLSGVRRKTFRSPLAAMGGFTRLPLLIGGQFGFRRSDLYRKPKACMPTLLEEGVGIEV